MENILLHYDFAGQIRMLEMEDRGLLLTAIYDYELGEPFDEGVLPLCVQMVFERIRAYLDRNRRVYNERCAQNTEYKNKNKYKYKHKNKSISPPAEEENVRATEQPAAPAHPHLCEKEKDELIEKGIAKEYIESRLSRAEERAAQSGQPIGEVLIGWWSNDRHTPPWNGQVASPPKAEAQNVGELGRSFDADDFFQAALNRSFREMGIELDSNQDLAPPS